MALFDAEKIFRNLVSAMGVTPEQITSLIVEVVTEVRTIRAERESFKRASGQIVPDVLARLERIEKVVWELHQSLTGVPRPLQESETDERNDRDHVNGS